MQTAASKVIVIRDDEPEALDDSPARAFTAVSDVAYVHVLDPRPIPVASHCFFIGTRADGRVFRLCDDARRHGARLTFIVRSVDRELARYVDETNASLIPACGTEHPITQATVLRAARSVLAGHRLIARGFIANSIGLFPRNHAISNTFVRYLLEASRVANRGTRVVAAVLSLHRTGSNFLRDLIGLTISGRADVFHEHEIPPAALATRGPGRPLRDQAPLEGHPDPGRLLRRARLRDAILNATRRFIFVSERAPDDRLTSYFQRRHLAWLRSSYDRTHSVLRDAADIQRRFDEWLKPCVRVQRRWYRSRLMAPFGLDILEAERTDDGFLVGQHAANTLLVVPTARLSALRNELASAFGNTEAYNSIASNSVKAFKMGAEIDRAFRRQVQFPPEIAEALWRIPEVACLHPQSR